MATDIRVPMLGESITEATLTQWYKQPGEAVEEDEPVCELETDKVTIDVPATAAGALSEILVKPDATVEVGAVLGRIAAGKAGAAARKPAPAAEDKPAAKDTPPPPKEILPTAPRQDTAPRQEIPPRQDTAPAPQDAPSAANMAAKSGPAVRHLLAQHGLDAAQLRGSGKDGRLRKADVLAAVAQQGRAPSAAKPPPPRPQHATERVRMSRLRQTIARRLKESQNTAATLTTFNEVDMGPLMELRGEHKAQFEQKHGVRLGFMGFFVRACVGALQEIPSVNAQIEGEEIVYSHAVHMGIAVATEKGLVVPVVRDAHGLSLAEIERMIADMGGRARDGQLRLEELQGGTFTISNGGVYGSLLSTPILNTPQSGVLGMHKIQERPAVVDGQVVARPMMYLALSYDHRLVDGKDAVTFLVRVKDSLENPERLLLEI
ncbi:MAG: 2-oxoglutarate dehydrogenase complex dihydrolipoyllysine-residue succinyltransferase [Hyphomicrobiales bacterium]|nr:2-oxoglutarate dehydrogenase complex dihydrolipoyllysine-residue succinyltransferase [Hyphomicrobiales bacterium]